MAGNREASSFVNSTVNKAAISILQHSPGGRNDPQRLFPYSQCDSQSHRLACVQNGLLMAPIHSLWDIFQWNGEIVPVKPKEWMGTVRLMAL